MKRTALARGTTRLNRAEMADLRLAAYERSGGMCECWRIRQRAERKRRR